MTFGLTPEEIRYITEIVVLPLERLDARVYCYGSRARGDHQRFSDLDLMVESSRDLGPELADIRQQLSDGNFPYKVDLVERRHFAKAYEPGYLRDRKPFAC